MLCHDSSISAVEVETLTRWIIHQVDTDQDDLFCTEPVCHLNGPSADRDTAAHPVLDRSNEFAFDLLSPFVGVPNMGEIFQQCAGVETGD